VSEYAFFLALILAGGIWPLVLVTLPLVLIPIWYPAGLLFVTLFVDKRKVDPRRVLGCSISLSVATVSLTLRIPEFAILFCAPYLASLYFSLLLSGREKLEARQLRLQAAIGLILPILWCFVYFGLGGEFVLLEVS
jgi:integral membrane sensor domain MASE1